MLSHAPLHHFVSCCSRNLLLLARPAHRRLFAASAPGSEPADLWIAKVVSTIFQRAPTHAAAAARLSPLRPVLSPSIVFTSLRRLPDSSSALGFFYLSRSDLAVVHLPQTFTFLISCLCRSGLHEDAVKLFDEMARDGHTVDDSFVEFLANSCFEAGKLDLATAFLAAVSKYGYRFQSYTFNKFLTSLVRRDRVGDAVLFLRQNLGSQFLAVDTCSFNIIIKGLCRIGDLDTALEFFNQMQRSCCVPDIVTYNILIDGLCKADQVDRGHEILQKIQLDSACVPNVVTYTSIISGYCKIGKMEEAYEVFDDMIGAGVKPSRVTFNVLINGSGQLDDAMKIWDEMNQKEVKPNGYTFAVVIHCLCRKNKVGDARNLLKVLSRRRDVVPQAFIYNPVIDGLCKSGNVDEANSVLLEMEERRCTPDKYTYTILIIGHCMKGRMFEAVEIFQKMVDSGCTPDRITVDFFVPCLLKSGFPHEINKIKSFISGRSSNFEIPDLQDIHLPIGKCLDISVAI
ncbi:pentatricopeptide repeat-containing protein At2g06000-like isoform X2 [Zingiber officinale]|uniref:pentatricopeptide repeat-containing protein At2g06000-like isoform X2 n=1 Tax=Zingiber officinale TaxID=94328 RepID=UPI001C4DA55C|nr:pentatricopeptide repeat-containing protein At2g06000-like isoform X2 [Zingiber officinale]